MHTGRGRLKARGQGTRGAYREHPGHGCDSGRVPVGNIPVELSQVSEEVTHVDDGRDAPVGDGAVLLNSGGTRVTIVTIDRRLQGGLALEGVGADPRQHRRRRRRRRWRRRRGRGYEVSHPVPGGVFAVDNDVERGAA